MSRSVKKTKIRGITTATTEKKDKQDANRKYRRITKQKVKNDNEVLPEIREISNVWSFNKDGKIYDSKMTDKDLKK
jgi:hypothetical protein